MAARRRPSLCVLGFFILVVAPCAKSVAQQFEPQIQREPALPPIPHEQPRFVPEPSRNELELPQVTREFVGRWGGHLYLLDSVNVKPAESVPTSLTFGQRSDLTVFVKTGVWGKPNSTVLQTEAKVISPFHIKITEQHLTSEGPQQTMSRSMLNLKLAVAD